MREASFKAANDSCVNQLLKEYSEQLRRIKDYAYFDEGGRKKFMHRFEESNRKVAKTYTDSMNVYLLTQIIIFFNIVA